MMRKYLFIYSEDNKDYNLSCKYYIVEGIDKEDAIEKTLRKLYKIEESFLDLLKDRDFNNASFVENFFCDNDDYDHDVENGLIEEIEDFDDELISRVRYYFKDNPKIAEDYLAYYFAKPGSKKEKIAFQKFLNENEEFLSNEFRTWDEFKIIDFSDIKSL